MNKRTFAIGMALIVSPVSAFAAAHPDAPIAQGHGSAQTGQIAASLSTRLSCDVVTKPPRNGYYVYETFCDWFGAWRRGWSGR